MEFSVTITKEDKISCSLDFFAAEDIMSGEEITSLKQIIDGQAYLVNAVPDFEINEDECVRES